MGRTDESLDLQPELGLGAFLANGEIMEVLDPIADVGRVIIGSTLPGANDLPGTKPKFLAKRNKGGKAVIQIELNYMPQYFPERVRFIKQKILEDLAQLCSEFEAILRQETLVLEFLPPEELLSLCPK